MEGLDSSCFDKAKEHKTIVINWNCGRKCAEVNDQDLTNDHLIILLLIFNPLRLLCLSGLFSTTPCTVLSLWESTWQPSFGCTPLGFTGSGMISFSITLVNWHYTGHVCVTLLVILHGPNLLLTRTHCKIFYQSCPGFYSWKNAMLYSILLLHGSTSQLYYVCIY